jgi:hypothetical protein
LLYSSFAFLGSLVFFALFSISYCILHFISSCTIVHFELHDYSDYIEIMLYLDVMFVHYGGLGSF